MYVISFYSFKGGVGRTMALVNIGVELARLGQKVLLVDFDLEAPSLLTFNIPGKNCCGPGIVEYITEYLNTDRAPNVSDYVSAPRTYPSGGAIQIMPAGLPGPEYQSKLTRINWLELYEHKSGYLLMEEMKAQWRTQLNPDYVLIDSRTGFSDVSGVCTRQLPDAVSFIFVPNRQALDGLAETVQQVRSTRNENMGHRIDLFFVESNVPYHDDERRTLETNRKLFKDRLGLSEFSATLHQYPHLSLLSESVFVEEFPQTSLAGEYRALAEILRRENLADRGAVLPQLRRMDMELRMSGGMFFSSGISDKLQRISLAQGTDPEVCFWLGRISRQLGEMDKALIQLNQAIEHGYERAEVFLERATLKLQERTDARVQEAVQDLRRAMSLLEAHPSYGEVLLAIRTLLSLAPSEVETLAESPAILKLPAKEQLDFANEMTTSDQTCTLAYEVLKHLRTSESLPPDVLARWRVTYSIICIRRKRFPEAIDILSNEEDSQLFELTRLFNLGIALWGQTGSPPVSEFERVLDLHRKITRGLDPNYLQCIAIAFYVTQDRDRALSHLDRARRTAEQVPIFHFSAARYLRVSPHEFVSDCALLARQMEEGHLLDFPAIRAADRQAAIH